MFGLKDHFIGCIMIPVVVENAALFQNVIIGFGLREGGKDGKFCQVKINFQQKIDESFDVILSLAIHSQ